METTTKERSLVIPFFIVVIVATIILLFHIRFVHALYSLRYFADHEFYEEVPEESTTAEYIKWSLEDAPYVGMTNRTGALDKNKVLP